jgi:hypothetical protein
LEMDALAISFESAHELLHRPALGRTDRIDIPWKEEFLDKPLFPLTYPQFYELWMRCLLVIGCRKTIRPYALRVGAGARMDGMLPPDTDRRQMSDCQLTPIADSLSSALRNYVMNHSGAIFETDYQTGVVRPNLAALAFGPKAVRRDETLFNDLRNMTLTRDEGAPISVSKEKIAEFQGRKDIARFRAEIQAATDQGEKNRLHRQIKSTIETCKKLQLDADRQAYFEEADRLRLRGLEPEPTLGAGGPGIAAPVAALLSRLRLQDESEPLTIDTSISELYIEAQRLHLSSIALSLPRQVPEQVAASKPQRAPQAPETAAASKPHRDSCCFVCSKGYVNRSCLTRHFRNKHLADGTFDKPFACRECKRAGATEVVVHGPAQWCNHLEHTHGLIHTPSVNPGASPRDRPSNPPLICLLCETPMASASTLLDHMNRTEIPRYRKGLSVACGACAREGQVDVKPMSIWEWLTHARAVHKWSLPHAEPCLLCGHLCTPGPGFRKHFTAQHSHGLGKPLECAACVASAMPAGGMQEIHGFEELLRHAMDKHSGPAVAGEKRKRDGNMDSECTAPAAKRKEGGNDDECTAPAAKRKRLATRKRAAKQNVTYKKERSSFIVYDTDSDLCHDVIICASTVDEQQKCYLEENHTGPSVILNPDFLRHVDPALLAP